MRGLAEYAMSGRLQAATVAVLFGLIPMPGFDLICGAIVALVILRRGLQDGVQILLWAVLPAALKWKLGDPHLALMLPAVVAASLVLRHSRSWQLTSLLMMASGVLQQWTIRWHDAYLARMHDLLNSLQSGGFVMQGVVDGKVVPLSPEQLMDIALPYYGVYQMALVLGCLLLGRYWQAHLYNPGGFRQEFHNLRFDWRLMVVLLALMVAGVFGIAPLSDWLLIMCLPPILEILAVIHKVVMHRNMGAAWLVLAYLLLFMPVAGPILVLLGFGDSLIDIRKRLAVDNKQESGS